MIKKIREWFQRRRELKERLEREERERNDAYYAEQKRQIDAWVQKNLAQAAENARGRRKSGEGSSLPPGLQDSTQRGGWNAFGTSYIGGSGNPYDS